MPWLYGLRLYSKDYGGAMPFKFIRCLKAAVVAAVLSCGALPPAVWADGELSGVSLRVYVDPTNAPFAFISGDLTKPEGLDIDILKELQRRLGFSLQEDRIFPLLRAQQIELFKQGEADVIGGGMSATQARSKFMDFSPIYFDTGMAVMFSKKYNTDISSYQDLAGKKVMVLKASSAETFAQDNLKDSEVVLADNIVLSYFAVAYGQVDAVIYDRPILQYFADTMPALQLEVTDETFARSESQYAFGFQIGSPYNRYFMQAFNAMKQDGTLDKFKAKWGLANAEFKR